MFDALNAIEVEWLKSFSSAVSAPFTDVLMKIITFSGNAGALWIFIAVLMICFKKTRRAGHITLVALVLCLVLNNLCLKNIFARTRPFDFDTTISLIIPKPGEFSFPSGHTLSSFAAATVIFFKAHKKYGTVAYIWATFMGISRLYFKVHYFTDVIFGAVIGVAIGLLSIYLTAKIINELKNNKSEEQSNG